MGLLCFDDLPPNSLFFLQTHDALIPPSLVNGFLLPDSNLPLNLLLRLLPLCLCHLRIFELLLNDCDLRFAFVHVDNVTLLVNLGHDRHGGGA